MITAFACCQLCDLLLATKDTIVSILQETGERGICERPKKTRDSDPQGG